MAAQKIEAAANPPQVDDDELPVGWAEPSLAFVTERIASVKPEAEPTRDFGYVDISGIDKRRATVTAGEVRRFKGADAPSRARRPIRPNDILFSNVRTNLRNVAMVASDLPAQLCSTGFTVLRSTPAILPEYLLRWVLTDEFTDAISETQTGTHYPATSDAQVLARTVRLAPFAEQKRIVAKVEALLAHVNAARDRLARVPAILKRFRQSVLAAGCSGRLTRDWRGQGVPETWQETTLGALAKLVTSGSRDWSRYYGRGNGTFIMAQNVRPLQLDLSYRQAVDPPRGDRDRARSQVESGDLLVTIVGANTGDVCRVPAPLPEHFVCQSVALIRPVLPEASPYLELFMNSLEHGRGQLLEYAYGEGRPHLSFDQLREAPILLPPLSEQGEIVRRAEALFRLADAIDARVAAGTARADRLTQSILAKAFRGELVPQDPNDEPALVMIQRVQADRVSECRNPGSPRIRRRSHAQRESRTP